VLDFVLSSDNVLDTSDTSLTPVNAKVSLKANNTKAFKVKLTLPTTTPGSYYVFVTVDPGNTLLERSIANNLLASSLPVTVS
jgi:uncharacterized membrane protein